MFCTQCGGNIPDGSTFCTYCGAPATPGQAPGQTPGPIPGPIPGQAPDIMPVPEAPGASNKGLKVAAITLSIVAVLAVIGVSAVVTNCFGLISPEEETSRTVVHDSSSKPKTKTEERSEPKAEAETDAEEKPDPKPEAETEPAPETEPEKAVEPSSIAVDLNSREEFKNLNIAISNFTEQGFDKGEGDKAFSRDNVDYARLVTFYYDHCLYNTNESGMEPVPENDPMLEGNYFSVRVPVSRARSFFETRMGVSPTDEQLSFDLNGPDPNPTLAYRAQVSGDWLYFGIYSGDAMPSQGVASATSVTDLGNNRYRVDYDVYMPGSRNNDPMMISEIKSDWYGLPANELEGALGAAGVDRSGSAIFEVRSAEGARKFVLEEMDCSTPA